MAVGQERKMTADQESELMELRHEAREAEAEWTEKDRIAKAAKKAMEAANDAVNAFIDDLGNPTPRLPFGDNGQADPLAGDGPATADAVPVAPSEDGEEYTIQADDERWKLVKFADMAKYGLKPGDIAKLASAYPPLHTMGDLVAWMAGSEHRRITDLDGIGDVAANRISDAMIKYYEANPRSKPTEAPGIASDAPEGKDGESINPTSEGRSQGEYGDPAAIQAEPSEADKQPIRKRKAKGEPETTGPLPPDPDQAEQDRLDQMHTEAERPDSAEEVDGFGDQEHDENG